MIETKEIELDQIHPNPDQPRQYFDQEKLQELADSIREQGQIQPIMVRPNGDGFVIVHGERRWRACQLAGLDTIRAEVREASADEAYTLSVVENEQREDISPIETAQAIHRMMESQALTQEGVARRISKSRTWVAQKLRLLNLPDQVKQTIDKGSLTEAHGRQLLKLKDGAKISELATQAVNGKWTVDRIQTEVDLALAGGVSQDTSPIELGESQKGVSQDNIGTFKLFWRNLTPAQQRTAFEWLKGVYDG